MKKTSLNSSISLRALICDIDGTITDKNRRINLDSVSVMRTLVDNGIPVVLASGNTVCSLTFLCKMIGTDGTIISENGGVYRLTYAGEQKICGKPEVSREAYRRISDYYSEKGIKPELYSPEYRFSDIAFRRDVDPKEVAEIVKDFPVKILDSGFAVHIQSEGVNKGTTFLKLADEMCISPREFIAIGDSLNDVELLENAGVGVAVAGGQIESQKPEAADYISQKKYGDGFSESVRRYFPSLF
ncbi:phosphoglycolate phosphatase (TIGR01487 family) [Methanomicrobium sp. W14]|uniref:phosphoglycolate phosphatase n=1 Tax=Methanomicrobium sp. W14 TaxID=2817839 RepID=UPI001AE8CDEF|nr:phosphoglycolate phosphatase [Methanomicrobium sp. W14]MBP2133915.1 phosphoglycolate phosphatase (TIGR01487 family) [Methanomicrobium sp. W14]